MDVRGRLDRFFWSMLVSELDNCRDHIGNISYQSLLYLDIVKYSERCTVGSIAEILGLDKSTVSRKVDSLVEEGLVSKVRNPEDGRSVMLVPGPGWSELYDKMDEPYERGVDRILDELSEEEMESFCRALDILSDEIGGGRV